MSAGIETEQCADCGKRYAGTAAKPRWAFTMDGALVGSVHASHPQQAGTRYRWLTASGDQSVDDALFDVWRTKLRAFPQPRAGLWSDADYAWMLASSPTTELSTDQRRRLNWWIEDGPLELGPDRVDGILAAHAKLVSDFLQWRSTRGDAQAPKAVDAKPVDTKPVGSWRAADLCAFCSGAVPVPDSLVAYVVTGMMACWDFICSRHFGHVVALGLALDGLTVREAA